MVSFGSFRAMDGVPIYLQIQTYIRRGCVAGTIRDGDELPSRRVLSSLLSVNPNTVQRAYKIMEDEGLIESRTGTKSCISITEDLPVRKSQKSVCLFRSAGHFWSGL